MDVDIFLGLPHTFTTMKKLYVWNWVGEGYNQCYAESPQEAIRIAENELWPNKGKVDRRTLKGLTDEQEKEYWKNFPLFD